MLLEKHFGCVRFVFNHFLALKSSAWSDRGENLSRYELDKMLPALKKAEETKWLSEVNAQSLQSSLINLDSAYTRFFKTKKGFPKFKSRRHNHQSFHVPQYGVVGKDFVRIPKVGKISAAINRSCSGVIKTITISRTSTGKYFASVLCENQLQTPPGLPVTEHGTVGIDLGLKEFAVLSTGERVSNPKNLKRVEKKLARFQRCHARRKRGSKNRNKQRIKVAMLYEKVANRRKDFLHKLTSRLVRDNQTDTFAIEDLCVRNMMKFRSLSKSILDARWSEFRRQLEYKSAWAGKNVIVIGRFDPSSKSCTCGKINHALKLSDRNWTCSCGLSHDRDLLAAHNIKRFALHPRNQSVAGGTGESTPAEIVVRRSLKQESQTAQSGCTGKVAPNNGAKTATNQPEIISIAWLE